MAAGCLKKNIGFKVM